MASLHKLPVLFFLVSLVLCFFSSRIIADLLANACNKDKACLDLLKADKAITAATNELNLGLAIMKSIIAQTKTTHDYLLKQKTKNPAYAYCEKEWLDMGPGFERILEITTKNKGYKEDADDYDFHVVGDGMGPCKSSLKDAKIDVQR